VPDPRNESDFWKTLVRCVFGSPAELKYRRSTTDGNILESRLGMGVLRFLVILWSTVALLASGAPPWAPLVAGLCYAWGLLEGSTLSRRRR
jgi:hypothetical protein